MDHTASRCKRQPIQHYLDQPDLPDHDFPEVPDPHSVISAFGRQSLGYSNLMREEDKRSCWGSHYGHLWNVGELAAVAESVWRAGDFAVLGVVGEVELSFCGQQVHRHCRLSCPCRIYVHFGVNWKFCVSFNLPPPGFMSSKRIWWWCRMRKQPTIERKAVHDVYRRALSIVASSGF